LGREYLFNGQVKKLKQEGEKSNKTGSEVGENQYQFRPSPTLKKVSLNLQVGWATTFGGIQFAQWCPLVVELAWFENTWQRVHNWEERTYRL
jgi:hypothetical protein